MSLFRPHVQKIAGYVPGEQPRETGWIKLNTNENPYPPSPRVREAVLGVVDGLNVYPDPLARRFCRLAGELFGVDEDWILAGNGSDEILTILMRSFVEPGEMIAYPYPSYVLYETLAELQGATANRIPLNADFSWNPDVARPIVKDAKLLFVPNPNSPTGTLWSPEELDQFQPERGLLVLDGAYADFATGSTGAELLQSQTQSPQTVLTRTLSKSYALAGLRFGFAVAHPDLIAGMRKVKDSYNCDALSIAAACAALEDQEWLRETNARILATRTRLLDRLVSLGFEVAPSEANFLWARHSACNHQAVYEGLKAERILVRYMRFSGISGDNSEIYDGLRISIGIDAQIDRMLEVLKTLI